MFNENGSKLVVPLDLDTLEQYCFWIIFKFCDDPFHQQQNSSRGDLIGGFFDRWINKIPESLIFSKLLEKYGCDEKYSVINDYFFYSDEKAKNAPDILGLADNKGNIYKFTEFKKDRWYNKENAPFIEMKTFRNSQKLITIPKTQFLENRFFVFVESNIDKLYLVYLFNDILFKKEKYLTNFRDNSDFICDNSKNILKSPSDVIDIKKLKNRIAEGKLNNEIGHYELLGIYTTDSLDGYYTTVSKILNNPGNELDETDDQSYRSEKPRYLDDVKLFNYDELPNVNSGEYYYFKDTNAIPIIFDLTENSRIVLISKNEKKLMFRVDGEIRVKSSFYIGEKYYCLQESFTNEFFSLNFNTCIRDFVKFYYLIEIKKEKDVLSTEEIELKSGIFLYYGKDFKNFKFTISDWSQKDFFICDCNKSSVKFFIGRKSNFYFIKNRNYISEEHDQGYYEMRFTSAGNCNKFEKIEANGLDEFNLSNADINPFKLNIELTSNSELKFIKKLKNDFIVKKKGDVKIDGEDIEDGFSKCVFRKNGEFIEKNFKKVKDPIIKEEEEPYTKKFYNHLDDIEHNVPVRISVGNGSNITILKKEKTSVFVKTNGKNIFIDNFDVSSDEDCVWKLTFKTFDRSSKKEEIVLSKGAIHFLPSDEQKLIQIFNELIK